MSEEQKNIGNLLWQLASSSLDHRPSREAYQLTQRLQSLLLMKEDPKNRFLEEEISMESFHRNQESKLDPKNFHSNIVAQAQSEAAQVALEIVSRDGYSHGAYKRCAKLWAMILVHRAFFLYKSGTFKESKDDMDDTLCAFALALSQLLSKASDLLEYTIRILLSKGSGETKNILSHTFLNYIVIPSTTDKSTITIDSSLISMSILGALNQECHRKAILDPFMSIASQFPSKQAILLSKLYLATLSSSDSCTLLNFCALKLKSQPESSLETITAIVSCLSKEFYYYDDDDNSNVSDKKVEEILQGKILQSCMKLLSSAKPILRSTCSELLTNISMFRFKVKDSESITTTVESVTDALCATLTNTTSTSSKKESTLTFTVAPLTSSDHRKNVYMTMTAISMEMKTMIHDISYSTILNRIASNFLDSISTSLARETISEVKEVGHQALISWMTLPLKFQNALEDPMATTGYCKAFEYCAKPMLDRASDTTASSSTSTNEFRIRLGAVLNFCDSYNLAEPILMNIMKKFGNVAKKGLEKVIENAVKKYSNSNLVPQIDGLIAVHLLLISCDGSLDQLLPAALKVLQAGNMSCDETSFLFSSSMMESCTTDSIVKKLLHRTIASFSRLVMKQRDSSSINVKSIVCVKGSESYSAAAYALACTIAHPFASSADTSSEQSSLQTVIACASPTDRAADAIVSALFFRVNELSLQREENATSLLHSKDFKESDDYTLPFHGANGYSVRNSSLLLVKSVSDSKHFALVLVLSHFATTMRVVGRKQRLALESLTLDYYFASFREHMALSDVASTLSELSTCHALKEDPGTLISESIFQSTLSAITTLGRLAGNFDESIDNNTDMESKPYEVAWALCIKELAPRLAYSLSEVMSQIEMMDSEAIGLYKSFPGKLYVPPSVLLTATDGTIKSKRGTEDEEWEKNVRRELEEKKKLLANSTELSMEEKLKISEQDYERKRIEHVVNRDLSRSLSSIQTLCLSDIEVGNLILPIVSGSVTSASISNSDMMKMKSFECFAVLRTLASCVYELDDSRSGDISQALITCQKKEAVNGTETIKYIPFPHECPSAASVINAIIEYGECLSASSFSFLFPIIRAALIGPRATLGCEYALKILDIHTELLGCNPTITLLRKDMASTVLELLSHDRSISFKDPTPVSVLVHIFNQGDSPSASELGPLLGDDGALGGKNARLATMTTIASILEKNPKLIKTNPLVENRVLVNCFVKDNGIRTEAKKAWSIGLESEADSKDMNGPSKIFAVALVPLLNHKDDDIAVAASEAFAFSVKKNPELLQKSLNRLFHTYIDSYATSVHVAQNKAEVSSSMELDDTLAPLKPKKNTAKLDIGSVKKIAAPKKTTVSAMSMLTKAPATKKKVSKPSALATFAPSKKERTLEQDELISQFSGLKVEDAKQIEADNNYKVSIRKGVLRVLTVISHEVDVDIEMLKLLVGFLMAYGLADVNQDIRDNARNVLRDFVSSNAAKDAMGFLLPLLETTLKNGEADKSCLDDLPTEKILDDTSSRDRRKEGVVVALGASAIHLRDDEDSDKINETFNMLIAALSTPSESVQSSVALCLCNLMKKGKLKDMTENFLHEQMHECLYSTSLAHRRGAAYGISAIVKGSGIASLKKYAVVKQLEDALTNGSSSSKEGALFAVELLSEHLGLLFEPYVIALLPALLKSFSDTSDHVRAAAKSSIGLIMSKLSGHGVKLLVPAVLAGLEEDDWRTKQASIHMLGSMSHCAPKQLASCLPSIVPKVTDAFSDTHPKVKASAKSSLEEISKVIRNPEISEISKILLEALTDPSVKTTMALESLIETEFVHAIDAASLSLVIPVIHRGLRDRAATTKRYGALIAGNICTMVDDPKDFVPYLPILIPDLKAVLLDPIPDCRSISAKALGSLSRSLGEATFPELRPWLIGVLKGDEGTSVERSGAAQGLTEILCAGGANMVENIMRNEILPLMSYPKSGTREGVLWVLTFLPSSLGHAFAPLIDTAFPALISGLSDENESVREVAMRAGRVTIKSHGKAHFEKILPSLEDGLNNSDYRIRSASLNLLGDLLTALGGAKMSTGIDTQDDIRQAERAQAQIALTLGPEIRKRVLSRLYLRRSDTAAVVRSSAVQVWKSVVSVTPRTLKEILDVLVGQIVTALASGHPDHTQVAGRCLGDIVSKLGDTVLPEIMPVLKDALYRGDLHTRLGACVGLAEVIEGSTKEQIIKYLHILVKVVQDALCDDEEEVRKIASSCFQNLYTAVGNKAFDEVVPSLLVEMESDSGDDYSRTRAINGVTCILSIRSRELLPYLIPRLLRKPVSRNQAAALGSICTVTGSSIHTFFSSIIPTLLGELSTSFGVVLDEDSKAVEDSLRRCVRSLSGSVDQSGVYPLICEIANKCSSDKAGIRKECCWMMQTIIEERKDKSDYFEHIDIILRELVHRLNDDNDEVLKSTHEALMALSTHVPAEELVKSIEFVRNLISSMVSDARRRKGGVGDGEFLLPGFNIPKGLEPMLPIYSRGILYGNPNIREVSAAGLGELIAITSEKYLAGPFMIKVTGPLLRIVGDRNPSNVKVAIIKTLGFILQKGGPALRAFVPQFQTTFCKALSDPSRQVRVEAIKALALLMPLTTRVDPLIKELVQNCTSPATGSSSSSIDTDETGSAVAVQTATLGALAVVLKNGGKQAKLPDSVPSALDAGKVLLYHDDDGVREGAAKTIAAACELSEETIVRDIVASVLRSKCETMEEKHGFAHFCRYILCSEIRHLLGPNDVEQMSSRIESFMMDTSTLVREASCIAVGALLGGIDIQQTDVYMKKMLPVILKCMDVKESMDVLKSMAKGLSLAVMLRTDVFIRNKVSLPILDAALKNSMLGQQRVQLAFNDFLWLALNVKNGDEQALNLYCSWSMFENSKQMKSLFTKILVRIKDVDIDKVY